MGSSVIGALRAVLGLDTAQFETNADKAKSKAGGLRAALLSTAASLTPVAAGAAAATLAVNGFAIGMKLAADAAMYADDIAAQSYKLGVSAEYLQAFNFAAGESDVPVDKAADALLGLTAAIGALQTHVGDGKIRKAMEALGITQDQIDSFKSVEDALPIIADKIASLGTVTEQLQFAKKFGIEALLPMLKQGASGIEDMMTKARDLGLVLDNEVIGRLADMSRQIEVADERSQMAAKSLGASLTPALVAMKEKAAELYLWLGRVIDRFNKIGDRSADTLRSEAEGLRRWAVFNDRIGNRGKADEQREQAAQLDEAVRQANRAAMRRRAAEKEDAPASVGSGSSGGEPRSSRSKAAKSKSEDDADLLRQARAHREAVESQANEYARIFAKEVIDPATLQEPIGNAVLEGAKSRLDELRQDFADTIFNATRNGLDALRYGGLKGFASFLADTFGRAMTNKLAGSITNFVTGKASATGLSGFLRSLTGFDSAGSFQVGGVGGTDSQLRLLRLSPQENVSITRGNDLGGRVVEVHVTPSRYFDAAVADVAAPMAVNAGVAASEVGSRKAQAALATSNRYRIAR